MVYLDFHIGKLNDENKNKKKKKKSKTTTTTAISNERGRKSVSLTSLAHLK